MSGEFGRHESGYFHTQMEAAAEDLRGGRFEITRAWAQFFENFKVIADAISYAEAGDSGQHWPIMETMARMQVLKNSLIAVEEYVEPFKDVAQQAVSDMAKLRK